MIDGWKKKSVGDIADVVTGKTPPTSDKTNYGDNLPFVSPADLGAFKYISKSEKHLSEKGAKKARILPVGTSLFTCIGSTIGKVGLTAVDLTTNQQINAAIPKNGSVYEEYLYYALCDIAPRVKRIAGVQAVPIINKTEFENQIIYLPANISEQKAIATLLSTWDEAIEKTERLIQAKEGNLKGQIQRIMGKEAIDANGWSMVHLGELFSEVTRKVGEKELTPYSISAGIGFVSQREKWGKDISGSQHKNYTHLKAGEFSYNKGNSKRYQQGCVYLLKDGEICVPNVFISFKPKAKNVVPEFFEHYFIADYHARELKRYITSGARSDGLLNLNKKDFFKIMVPCPSPDEQKAIAEALTASQQEIDLLKQLADKYNTQKRGLMQKMLTGEWRVKPEIVNQYMEA